MAGIFSQPLREGNESLGRARRLSRKISDPSLRKSPTPAGARTLDFICMPAQAILPKEDGVWRGMASRDFERVRELGDAWMNRMRAGDLAAAWRISDQLLRLLNSQPCHALPRHYQWIWRGESLRDKRVLIRCYHGLGDTIQFIRYVPLVRRIACEVSVWAQPELIPLLAQIRGIDQLLPLHDGTPEVDYDLDVEIMELPYIFRTTAAELPLVTRYLTVAPTFPSTSQGLAVGLVWRAGDWDERRSIPTKEILRLEDVPGVTFHVLQLGEAGEEALASFGIDAREPDLLSAASVIAGLDLLITVDSMAAHLSGALGIPTWTLLPEPADWRWMNDRTRSSWYPTMRLFRQPQSGDWESLLATVSSELERAAAEWPERAVADGAEGYLPDNAMSATTGRTQISSSLGRNDRD